VRKTARVIGRRRSAGALLPGISVVVATATALASCSSGHGAAPPSTTVPRSAVPVVVPVAVPGSAPLPANLRVSKRPSACAPTRPRSFPQTGVARLDIALVAVAPVTAEVCVYGGASARALRGRVSFDGAAASTVVNALNTVAGIDPVSGPRCEPGADAPVVVLVSDGLRTEALWAALTGCRGVSNGLLSGAGTASSTAILTRSVALAGACAHRFGRTAACVAGTP
jgi:hypothetical protein